MSDDSERLLSALISSNKPIQIPELKKALGLEKKQLNRMLYSFQEKGMVVRIGDSKPSWTATVAAVDGVHSAEEKKLLGLLSENAAGNGRMSTGTIAAFLDKSVAAVNKTLYGLERDARVERSSMSPPTWKIIQKDSNNLSPSSSSSSSLSYSSDMARSEKHTARNKKRHRIEAENEEHERKRQSVAHPLPSQVAARPNDDLLQQSKKETFHHDKDLNQDSSWAKKCADAVWKEYRQLNSNVKDNDIIAGFVIRQTDCPECLPRVVAIGSGTKCCVGNRLSCEGSAVHDSHAEVVARRSFIRWLYNQLTTSEETDSFASRNEEGRTPFELRQFELWFYVSQAPCGDAAVFSRSDPQPQTIPCWTSTKHGILRTKNEAGMGTIPVKKGKQTMDGLIKGDKVMNHSCSDKLAKWAALGVQGAFLSRLIPPVYIAGVVVGDLFSRGHISRAICCRSERALEISKATLIAPFRVTHPQIHHASLSTSRAKQTKKHGKESHNWAEHDTGLETVDSTTGRQQQNQNSRICKRRLFSLFCSLDPLACKHSYAENKALAESYQANKGIWIGAMKSLYRGCWMCKPCEVNNFFAHALKP